MQDQKEDFNNLKNAGSYSPLGDRGIKVFAPATIANLVCGFDVLGMALQQPQDIMTLRVSAQPGLTIAHTDGYDLPVEPEKNVAGAALLLSSRERRRTDLGAMTSGSQQLICRLEIFNNHLRELLPAPGRC